MVCRSKKTTVSLLILKIWLHEITARTFQWGIKITKWKVWKTWSSLKTETWFTQTKEFAVRLMISKVWLSESLHHIFNDIQARLGDVQVFVSTFCSCNIISWLLICIVEIFIVFDIRLFSSIRIDVFQLVCKYIFICFVIGHSDSGADSRCKNYM